MLWEDAQALLGQARCLIALGRSEEATTRLRAARDIFSSLGAVPALAETVGLLERASTIASRPVGEGGTSAPARALIKTIRYW